MTKLDHSNLVYFRPILLLLDMGNPLKSPLFRGIAKKLSPLLGLQKCKTSAFVTYLGNCISVLPTLNNYLAKFVNFVSIFQKILIFFQKESSGQKFKTFGEFLADKSWQHCSIQLFFYSFFYKKLIKFLRCF